VYIPLCLHLQVSNFALSKGSDGEDLMNKLVLLHQRELAEPLPKVGSPASPPS